MLRDSVADTQYPPSKSTTLAPSNSCSLWRRSSLRNEVGSEKKSNTNNKNDNDNDIKKKKKKNGTIDRDRGRNREREKITRNDNVARLICYSWGELCTTFGRLALSDYDASWSRSRSVRRGSDCSISDVSETKKRKQGGFQFVIRYWSVINR